MLLAAIAVLAGFVVLIWSADLFVAGAASIAANLGLSPIIIGITIVSIGTSAPEILVSITAALTEAGELAIGNAIGSNIANVGLVLGLTVLIVPMKVQPTCMRREIPALLLVTMATALLLLDGVLSRVDGIAMVVVLCVIMSLIVRNEGRDSVLLKEATATPAAVLSPLRAWLTFAAGLVLLIISSRLLVWGATGIALQLGVSQLMIGLTVVAIGTSLPELAATIASALRGHTDIAIGNVIGSNLFNLLAVMAIPGLIEPQALEPLILYRDYLTMTGLTVLLAATLWFGRLRRKAGGAGHAYLGRSVGILLLSIYALYYYWLYRTR
ncbi:calcium/sodium antiporter [Kineobactrum salinum]|uniref:calcium/sodium antiporter n=1 Tax=Kineobactrum salinum TaxID=2708301 RepID=UPI0018D99799|nr:calcium/sodium antiporter [Kineobactrum salinum]